MDYRDQERLYLMAHRLKNVLEPGLAMVRTDISEHDVEMLRRHLYDALRILKIEDER